MGAMGFSLPAAIGAWHAHKKNDIIVICGDGGLQINIQELETVSRNNIPMKLFVFNNRSLGMVREFQDLYFNKNYQSTVKGYGNPDFKKLADAYHFEYLTMSTLKKNDPLLKAVLAHKGPLFVEVDIDITATLQPKVVYGHALDDQAPYLDEVKKAHLEALKESLKG
jgi:acetolactate synthase-1/2/3 large subunit